ncbi:MAG: hypothetical protein R3E01_10930 [Pirellulaceae bacterium]
MITKLQQALGTTEAGEAATSRDEMLRHIGLQMKAASLPIPRSLAADQMLELADALLANYQEKARILLDERSPADARIETFLRHHFADLDLSPRLRLPHQTLILDRHGMGRELSLPIHGESFRNDMLSSYRLKNGVLHNPRHDRRTTAGTFHIAEGGMPIPGDKRAVPKRVFAKLFQIAINPPRDLLRLPFTSEEPEQSHTFVSLYLRPIVCPEVPGITPQKSMEIRFFAPGGLVSNLDFVESIFGNAGDPLTPENDAGLDVEHWTGHTGCVILAPQMLGYTKKELGLPHYDDATQRRRNDSMCWRDEGELYNDGQPFKISCRTDEGVVITLIADNYYGYCKKEVKTQISYAANLYGNVEEEHAGGAVAYPTYNLGDQFQANSKRYNGRTFADVARDYADFIDVKPEGYGVDRNFPNLIYIPEDAFATLQSQRVMWTRDGIPHAIPLLPGNVYMAPSGYKLTMEKHPAAPTWRIVGQLAEGVYCHKPCTVSGGGKSEISKSLLSYMHYGPIFVADWQDDLQAVQKVLDYDFSTRWRHDSPRRPDYTRRPSRPIMGPERSLGSVIKLLSPSAEYTDEYNQFLRTLPIHLYAILLIIKRFDQPDWRDHFGVDIINGHPGHELKFQRRKLVGSYLRVGFYTHQAWRTYKLRQDFLPATKVQREDDISASMVVPTERLASRPPDTRAGSCKFVENCEYRFYQRPDDAIHRGFDVQAEADLAGPNNFISNFEPLTREDVARMAEYVADFDAFSPPMQELLRSMLESDDHNYVVCSANPRNVGGVPSKNPRYLQNRPDLVDRFTPYVSRRGAQLFRALAANAPVHVPVHAVLMGRRNNPPDTEKGIRSLAVYNPLHYQELPELFMDLICSLTGKSPSTTGFGSEGALTKGPFNSLRTAADLNAALVSHILTGLAGFSTPAGHIGPNVQVDHDISLLIPEIWCRLTPEERDPRFLIEDGCLEPLHDFPFDGHTVPVSRLGYRMTARFLRRFCGRVFDNPIEVFDETILQPEKQDAPAFYQGIRYICDAQRSVAQRYFEDGTIEEMCPPLQAVLAIMAHGNWKGHDVHDPVVREMFTLPSMLESKWYRQRLHTKQQRDIKLWHQHLQYLDDFMQRASHVAETKRLQLDERRAYAAAELKRAKSADYVTSLVGYLGADPMSTGDTADEVYR